jgi:hypothetical protein
LQIRQALVIFNLIDLLSSLFGHLRQMKIARGFTGSSLGPNSLTENFVVFELLILEVNDSLLP